MMRRKSRLLIPALLFSIIFATTLPYISSLIPNFTNYNSDIFGGSLLPPVPSNIYDIFKDPNDNSLDLETAAIAKEYSGVGQSRLIVQNASSTNPDQYLQFAEGASANAQIILGANWEATQITSVVYDLWDDRDWASNGDFSLTGSTNGYNPGDDDDSFVTNWAFTVLDNVPVARPYVNPMSGNYLLTGGNPNERVELRMDGDLSAGYYGYNEGDSCWWSQTVNVPRGTVIDAAVEFDLYTDHLADFNSWIFYIAINGQNVYAEGTYNIKNWGYSTWHSRSIPLGVWSNSSDVFSDPINGNVDIEFGLTYTSTDARYSSGFTDIEYQQLWIDNFRLVIKSEVQPTQIDLEMNGNNVVNTGWGTGTVTEIGSWTSSPITATFSENLAATGSTIELRTNLTANAYRNDSSLYERNTASQGISFSIDSEQSSDIVYDFYAYISVPTGYTESNFYTSFPTNWVVTWVSEPQNPNVNVINDPAVDNSTAGFLNITVPPISQAPDGFWQIKTSAPNPLTGIAFYNETIQKSDFRISDILNTTVSTSVSGNTQLLIYDPNENLFRSNDSTLFSYNNSLDNAPVGNYTAIFNFNDSVSNPLVVGQKIGYFTVTHGSRLITSDNYLKEYLAGEKIDITVYYDDTESGFGDIDNANVTFVINDWNGLGSDAVYQTGDPEVATSAGKYILSVPTDPSYIGSYMVDIYASKTYYDSKTNLSAFNVLVLEDMTLSFSDVPVTPYGDNSTITIQAENSTGPLIGAIISTNASLNIINTSEVNGTYTIDIETDALSQGNYLVQINVNKSFHYNRSLLIPLTIRNITSDFTYDPPGQEYWSDTVNATITFYYLDLDHGGAGIDGATITLTDWTDSGGVGYNFVDPINYTVYELGSGVYEAHFKMDNLTDQSPNNKYTFNFSASRPNFRTRELYKINLTIISTNTRLDSPEYPASIIPQGPYNITIEYWDLDNVILIENNTPANPVIIQWAWDNSTLNGTSTLIQKASNDSWFLEIDTTGFDINIKYNLTVKASKAHYDPAEMNITIGLRQNIAAIGVTNPPPTVWGESVSFYASYTDQAGNSLVDNATIDLYWFNDTSSSWELFRAGYYINDTSQSIPELNTVGVDVNFTVNTSAYGIPSQGYHRLNVTMDAPNYDRRSAQVRLYVRPVDAQLFYDVPPVNPYGTNTTFHVTYQDTYHYQLINSSNTVISVNIDPLYYSVTRDEPNGNYLIEINTTYWGTAGTFPIIVSANWSGSPYYENGSVQVLFTVRNGSTEILYIPPGSIAWGLNISALKIQFHETDNDTYPDILAPDATVYLNGTDIAYVAITGPGLDNYYSIENINTSTLAIGTHRLNITIVKTHFDPAERIIPITIRTHNTELLYTPPGQIPYGSNATIRIWYHDLDLDNYPIMDMASSLLINGSSISYGSTSRVGNSYYIYDIKMDNQPLGNHVLNITVTNSSDLYDTATITTPITVRNISTSLSYTPPGIVPYSATENTTFDITYKDEFGVGIIDATVNLTLLYENGLPTTTKYIYNENWTYYYQGGGIYLIHVTIENLTAQDTTYTFQIDVNKTNYVSQSLFSVNMTIRSTYTLLYSPQQPSSIIPLGEYNITIFYEDREAGVRISNETTEPYHVNMTFNWDNSTLQGDSQLIQIGDTSPYWILSIDTTGYNISLTYVVTITANKTYYEHQEINITIQLRRNQPIMGIVPPEPTVWGENVTFNVTYTTLDGNYIPNTTVEIDWFKGPTQYYTVTDLLDGTYSINLDTSAKALPASGYYMVRVNCSEESGTYEQISQQFKLNIRAIDTQILYDAPQVTPYRGNVTFTIEYRDTFHDLPIINDANVSITLDLDIVTPGIQGTGYYNWSRVASDYAITINSTFWAQPGTYPFIIYANWSYALGPNEPYYANTSIQINLNIRNRSAQISYTPIGSEPWGKNISVVIDYYDIDSASYIPIPNNASVSLLINGTPTTFDYVIQSSSWTITNINTSRLTIGDYLMSITINNTHYSDATLDIPFTIRQHGVELLYTPPGQIPWGNNISALEITFHDTDLNSYPLIDMNNNTVMQINGTSIAHGIVTFSSNVYTIHDIDTEGLDIGVHTLNITVDNSSYNKKSIFIDIQVRSRRVLLTGIRPNPTAFGNNVTFTVELKDIDDPAEPGLNFTLSEMEIHLLNDTSYDWIPTLATWTYGPIAGEYIITFNTFNLDGIDDYNFTVQINYTIAQHYENASLDTVITTRERNTLITYDSPATTYYGNNVTIRLYYQDLDGVAGPQLIFDGIVSVFQPGVYDNSQPGLYLVTVNTSEFITQDKLDVHQVNVSISYSGKPFFKNASVNVSIVCRKIETYRDVYIQKGVIEGESVSGYPWGPPGVNITIEYIGYEGIYDDLPINNSNIQIALPAPYNNPANYKIYGMNALGQWEERTNSTSGIFKLFLDGSVPENNIPYRFNITLFNSSDPDEPYKNQSFTFTISFRKPVTNVILFYESYVPWGTNITFNVLYWNVEQGSNITGATIDPLVTLIEDPATGDVWDSSNWTAEFGDFMGNISDFSDGIEGYIVTMNTSWVPRNLKFYWRISANKTEVAESFSQAYVIIRDIRIELEIVVSQYEIKTDIVSHFNFTIKLYDLDAGRIPIAYGSSDPRYENVTFWMFDFASGGSNYTNWGRNFQYGDFEVYYNPIGENYTFKFNIDINVSDSYIIYIRANGSHLGGPQIGEEYAEDSRPIILTIKNHHTNITINPDELYNGEKLFPQVPELTNIYSNNTIIYGEDINVSAFWYDLNSSEYISGPYNESGIETWPIYNISSSSPFAGRINLRDLVTIHNLYLDDIYPSYKNISYKGIFLFEIKTSILKDYYPFEDLVNGGPFGNGTYNLTINIHYDFANAPIIYLHTNITFWLHVLPVNTTLGVHAYKLHSVTGQAELEIPTPVIPFGAPGSFYYFTIEFNYTEPGQTIEYIETYSLKWWNIILSRWEYWEPGKVQYSPNLPQHILKIYTDTIHTENSTLFPWNSTGYKNVTLQIEFNKTNYIRQIFNTSIFLRKHNTELIWVDQFGALTTLENTTKYFNPSFNIYFRFKDLDNEFPTQAYYSGSELYIRYANISFTGWPSELATISETATPGIYLLSIISKRDAGSYNITIFANDTSPLEYRNNSVTVLSLQILQANVEFSIVPSSLASFEFDLIDLTATFVDEYGNPIDTASVQVFIVGVTPTWRPLIPIGGGIYKAQIVGWGLKPGIYIMHIMADPNNDNYATFEGTIQIPIFVQSFTTHWAFIIGMIGLAAAVGFFAYRQIKWWLFTPYAVKQIVRTKKIIKKQKELSPDPTVRDRKEIFADHYADDWASLSLKPHTMVSTEVVEFAKELSDIRRTRVTTTEAKSLMLNLQAQPDLQAADGYLEKLMIPPEARRTLLTIAGLIKYKRPEVLDFTLLLSEIKGRTYTYDDGEKIYNKLKTLKPSDADSYLWNTHLISVEDRIRLLDTIGISTDKLKKKRRKALQPMSNKEIKAELRTIPSLSVESRKEFFEQIKVLTPKDQRKFISNLRAKQEKRIEKKRVKEAEKPKGLTAEQIDQELKSIPGLSDEDRKMIRDSILLLDPDEQRTTIDDLKKQYTKK